MQTEDMPCSIMQGPNLNAIKTIGIYLPYLNAVFSFHKLRMHNSEVTRDAHSKVLITV